VPTPDSRRRRRRRQGEGETGEVGEGEREWREMAKRAPARLIARPGIFSNDDLDFGGNISNFWLLLITSNLIAKRLLII
jgi:16S rRNA G1207 methylase RsmC